MRTDKVEKLIASSFLLIVGGAAHAELAELLVPKGTKATVTVEYSYAATGNKKDKYDPREWQVVRTVQLTAQFAADKPQAMAQLRTPEASQLADLRNKRTSATNAATKMKPMMDDMVKIVERCAENEACIEKEIANYGNNLQMTPEIESAGKDIESLSKSSVPRYQMWKATAQKGTYFVQESYRGDTADPACMEKPKQRCHREETRKGGGNVPAPPGKVNASGAMFEVDAQKKDIVMTLPVPMMPLTYNREVKSDFPGEGAGSSQGIVNMKVGNKPLTVTIPGDLKHLSGTERIKAEGVEGEGGTFTVKWTLAIH